MTTTEPVAVVDERFAQHCRWTPGERLHDVFAGLVARFGDRPAIEVDEVVHTFADVDRRARAIAGLLHRHGVAPGDRVALVLDEHVDAYAAMLAASRVGAAYVPLDSAFPDDRIAWICSDAQARVLLTASTLMPRLTGTAGIEVVDVDTAREDRRLDAETTPESDDDTAYVIYTSGTTGRPKGVVIDHSAICNFLRVAAEVYGFEAADRVYVGMTVAFDFSVEESWVPWMAGATLVPRPGGRALVGQELQEFLLQRRITALCCVPTLLSTLDADALDTLRFLLVSGEACPQQLVARWHREHRRFLNVYGPTEATVTATWTPLHPDRAVTLGRPLPTYQVLVLHPECAETLPAGEAGEIAIAGVGLAVGYLGRDDLTARAFVPDPFGLAHNPGGRLYRTGDLGRLTDDGEIVYLGRIDSQVKIRGYRIELTEIESVLLAVPGVAQAAVATWEPVPGTTELVAYYATRSADGGVGVGVGVGDEQIRAALAERLPSYMVPAYYERLDVLPMTTSDKIDRRALPVPSGTRAASTGPVVAPATATERTLATVVGETLGVPVVSVTADLFADLGANSLSMARICAAARSRGVPASIRDCYLNPTVRALAAALDTSAPSDSSATLDSSATRDSSAEVAPDIVAAEDAPAGTPAPSRSSVAFAATGVAQLALLFGYVWLLATIAEYADRGAGGGTGGTLAAIGALIAALCALPVAAKWLLVGRWRESSFALWTPRYLRFWAVKTLVRANPLAMFAGTPVYNAYLRSLGVRVGARSIVLTRHVPVCGDLVRIGADSVVRADVWLQGYRVDDGVLRTGRVELGEQAFVGEGAVIDVDTAIGARGQLAHASSLQRGQRVPADAVWHGSPARPAGEGADFRRMPTDHARGSRLRPVLQGVGEIAVALLAVLGLVWFESLILLPAGDGGAAFYGWTALCGVVTVVGGAVLSMLVALAGGRLLGRVLVAGRDYRTHGVHHALLRIVELLSNRPFVITLLGDSALITGWMRALGWRLGAVDQTGSNFGTTHRQQVPTLTTVGAGTMISDGLSVVNADISSSHLRVREAAIGGQNFLGNKLVFPAGARVGEDVLLATKVLVPLDGPVRTGVGLLGSPAFEIPRTVERDRLLAVPVEQRAAALRAKLRHNLASMAVLLLARSAQLWTIVLIDAAAIVARHDLGAAGVAAAFAVSLLAGALWSVAVERLMVPGRRLAAQDCSIHEPYFWRHERLWKLLAPYLAVFDGTPVKPVILRLLGVRVGARLFDDGAAMSEHTLVALGSDVTLNAGAVLQGHSLEDGAFKSDHIVVGDRVTLGVGAFVHYGTMLRDGASVAADSFVMKGSELAPGERWAGNPAVPTT